MGVINNKLAVTQALQRVANKGIIIRDPKTSSSKRSIFDDIETKDLINSIIKVSKALDNEREDLKFIVDKEQLTLINEKEEIKIS
ncbi:site-specific integrase [Orenia marismortui]|uniref:hypothetical protein n=1 Tax=Orenia marismortui TaxID=46469 RepID=UPI0003672A75|nr:hypothetical protein [Orenia marismortui]